MQENKSIQSSSIITNIQRLEEAIEGFKDKETYMDFLRFCKKFYKEDFKNQLLIFQQCKYANIIKSFIEWKFIGRKLKKNPRSIYVYRPYKKKERKSIKGQLDINGKELKERKNNKIETIGNEIFERINKFDISDTIVDRKSPYKDYKIQIDNYIVDKTILLNCLEELYPKYNKKIQDINIDIVDRLYLFIKYIIEDEKDLNNNMFLDSLTLLVANYFDIQINIELLKDFKQFEKLNMKEFLNFGIKLQKTSESIIDFLKESLKNKLCA